MEKVVRLSDMCTDFVYQESDHIRIADSKPLSECHVKALPSHTVGDKGDGRILPRQFFHHEETFSTLGVIKTKVESAGTQTWDDSELACLYETAVEASGLQIWKYRKCEPLEGGKTKVTEIIKGSSPTLIKLVVSSQTSKGHRTHMDKYHELFR